jgi:molybdopterin synthase sulfur carrier subunit
VQANFYATLRPIVGGKTVEFDLAEGANVEVLLRAAGERFPKLVELTWNDDGTLRDFLKVFVDGREIRNLQMLATPVPADAVVDIFPPVAGG